MFIRTHKKSNVRLSEIVNVFSINIPNISICKYFYVTSTNIIIVRLCEVFNVFSIRIDNATICKFFFLLSVR